MSKGPEAKLQLKIRKALTKRFPDIFLFKVHGNRFQASGLPDLIGCVQGKMIGIEVKIPGKEHNVTPLQLHQITKLNEAGGFATVVSSVDAALSFVENLLET